MIETEKLIEIIKTAHSLGAKRIEIDADGSIAIEWSQAVTISTPQIYPQQPLDPDKVIPPGTMAYMAQFTTTICEGDKK